MSDNVKLPETFIFVGVNFILPPMRMVRFGIDLSSQEGNIPLFNWSLEVKNFVLYAMRVGPIHNVYYDLLYLYIRNLI